MTHQPVGDFEMPLVFNEIPKLENLNKVQVNVFCYQKNYLIPLRLSEPQEVPLILDFLLLSDCQAYP